MATNITTVHFIVVIEIAVMYFHTCGRYCLILEIVTGEYVCLITAVIGLIISYNHVPEHNGDQNDISLFTYLVISSYLATVYLCLGIKIVFTFSWRNFGKLDFSVSMQYVIFTIGK